jgi:hypothetical protein
MASTRSKINAALRSLLGKRRGQNAIISIIDKYERQMPPYKDDREMVLLCTALVEQTLESAILASCLARFEKSSDRDRLFGGDPESGGAVSTFAGKIILGQALGLYGEYLKDDLDRLRRIRNVFAHAKTKLTLETSAIKNALSFNLFDPNLSGFAGARTSTPRGRFLGVAGLSVIHLLRVIQAHKPLRPRGRPTKWVFEGSPKTLPHKRVRQRHERPSRDDPKSATRARPPRSSPA